MAYKYTDKKRAGRNRSAQWRGKVAELGDTPPENIEFAPGEYELLPDRLKIALATVLAKLPAAKKKKYIQLDWQRKVVLKEGELYEAGLLRTLLSEWLNGFVAQTQDGRQYSVVYQTLCVIEQLVAEYGVDALNAALLKNIGTGRPETCTIQYLKAILKRGYAPDALREMPPRPTMPKKEEAGSEWDRIIRVIKHRLKDSESSFNTWIRPCTPLTVNQAELRIACRDDVAVGWLSEHYTGVFSQAHTQIFGVAPAHLEFVAAQGDKTHGTDHD